MTRRRRYDAGTLNPPERLTNGWLRADAFVTRAGVFSYRDPDGTERRELRHPDDVFDAASLASLVMVPMTDGHPSMPLDATNAQSLSIGHLGERIERADGDLVRAMTQVTHAPAIEAVESGTRRELSCGYDADVVEESGEYEGEPYTHRQRQIRYNHVAIVPAGRAGPLVRMRVDGVDSWVSPADGAVQVPSGEPSQQTTDSMPDVGFPSSKQNTPSGGQNMATKYRKDGLTIELEENQIPVLESMLAQVLNAPREEIEALKTKLVEAQEAASKSAEEATEALDEEKAEKEKESARADALAAEVKKLSDPATIAAAVNERVALVGKASPILGSSVKLDGLSELEIKKAVAEKLGNVKLDGKPDAYIHARYDAQVDLHAAASIGKVRAAPPTSGESHADAADPSSARARMIADNASRGAKA